MSEARCRTLEALSAHTQRQGPEVHTRPEGITGCGPRGGGLGARGESEPHAYHTHESSHTLPTDIQQTPCPEQGMPGVCTSIAQNMTLPVIHTAHRATDGRIIKPSGTQADWQWCTSMSFQGIERCSVAGGSKSCNKVAVGEPAAGTLSKLQRHLLAHQWVRSAASPMRCVCIK